MIDLAMAAPVMPFAARTRDICAYVLCTFHCAHMAKAIAGRSRTIVGSKPNMNMGGETPRVRDRAARLRGAAPGRDRIYAACRRRVASPPSDGIGPRRLSSLGHVDSAAFREAKR